MATPPPGSSLSNSDIAAVFSEMAELLAIQGGEPHRVRSFHRSARILENLPEPAQRMLRYGTLQKTPGVGEGTLHRVKQVLRTGTCDDLRRLRAALPGGLRDLVRLKGLGTTTVRQLYHQLRIRTVDELEAAARSGRLLQLPRWSVERVHGLLREIAVFKNRRGQLPLVEALPVADAVIERLRAAPGCRDAIAGGSIRRWQAMIGDLDFLGCADDARPLVAAFCTQPGTEQVLSQRVDGGSVRLGDGRQADLWVFPTESWGAGLHAFSGTKEHVVALRTRAGRMGLHISEHGVFSREPDRRLITPAPHEEEIFSAVGLPFILPELRLHLGEMEAAERGRLPRVVDEGDLRGDLHLHTTWSDGSGSARDMAQAAIDLDYEYLAVTDHSQSSTIANGLDAARLKRQIGELRELEQDLGRIHVLAGVEVDILADGSLDVDADLLRRLDWVVASVHDHFELPEIEMTRRIIAAMESGLVDCIGHPTGRKLGRREGYAVDMDALLDAARRLGVALEVNGNPRRMDMDEIACRQARELGVMVTIDTDAHSPAHLARRRFGLAMARRGWLEPRHVLNAQPVETLQAFRHDRMRARGIAATPRQLPELATAETSVAKSAETMEPAEATSAVSADPALVAALDAGIVDEEMRARVERFLAEGDDDELAAALTELGDNPVQQAFNLLINNRGSSAPTKPGEPRDAG